MRLYLTLGNLAVDVIAASRSGSLRGQALRDGGCLVCWRAGGVEPEVG